MLGQPIIHPSKRLFKQKRGGFSQKGETSPRDVQRTGSGVSGQPGTAVGPWALPPSRVAVQAPPGESGGERSLLLRHHPRRAAAVPGGERVRRSKTKDKLVDMIEEAI